MDDLDRMFRRLVQNIRMSYPDLLGRPFEVSQLYQNLLPYRHNRRELEIETNQDYEIALMRLLSGERGYLIAEDALQDAMRTELASRNPDTAAFRVYAASHVSIAPEAVRRLESATGAITPSRPSSATLPPQPAEQSAPAPAARASAPTAAPPRPAAPPPLPPPAPAPLPPRAPAPPAAPFSPQASAAPARPAAPSTVNPKPGSAGTPSAPAPAHTPPIPSRPSMAGSTGNPASTQPFGRPSVQNPVAPPRASTPAMPQPTTSSAPRNSGAGSCRYCSGALPAGRSITFCPHCGQNLTIQHCPACSTELEIGWKFCTTCGRSIGASA